MGDGILVDFGVLEPNPWRAKDGVHAALALRQPLAAYNRDLADRGLPRLTLGIGVHCGRGVVDLVGSREKQSAP